MSETDDPPPVMVAAPTAPLLREGMLSNAVSFLSHSQVRGSTDEKKREFLVQKGLTDEEIEEAYKRVPPAPPVSTSVGALPFPPPGAPLPPPPPGSMALANVQRMRWTQMVLAAGGLTAGTWYAAAYARKLLASSSSATAAAVAAIVEPTSSRAEVAAAEEVAPSIEEVTALVEVPEVNGEAVNAMVVGEVQRMRATMTEALLESQSAQLASTTEALATLMQETRSEAQNLPMAVRQASIAGVGELKAELRHLTDAFAVLASAATTPASTPVPAELHDELRDICSLLKATLRLQPELLPLPAPPTLEGSESLALTAPLSPGTVAKLATAKLEQANDADSEASSWEEAAAAKLKGAFEVKAAMQAAKAKSQAAKRVKAVMEAAQAESEAKAAARTAAAAQADAVAAARAVAAATAHAVSAEAAVAAAAAAAAEAEATAAEATSAAVAEENKAKAEGLNRVKAVTQAAQAQSEAKAAARSAVAAQADAQSAALAVAAATAQAVEAEAAVEQVEQTNAANAQKRARNAAGFPSSTPPPTVAYPPPVDAPQYSKSYREVMDMLTNGETPPGIRDIDDRPPNPEMALPAAKLQPRAKPWEKKAEESASGSDGENPGVAPWLLQDSARQQAGAAKQQEAAAKRVQSVTAAAQLEAAAKAKAGIAAAQADAAAVPWAMADAAVAHAAARAGEVPGDMVSWKPPPRPGVTMATAAEAMGMGKSVGSPAASARTPLTAEEKAKAPAMHAVARHSRAPARASESSSSDEAE